MENKTGNERRQLSSKAPFVAGIVFFALGWLQYDFLFSESSVANVKYLGMASMGIYMLLGIFAVGQGIYLQRTGATTFEAPRAKPVILALVALVAITAIGAVAIFTRI